MGRARKGSVNSQKVAKASASSRSSTRKRTQVARYVDDESGNILVNKRSSDAITVYDGPSQPLPTRNKHGELIFPDYPHFRPNLTPAEVIRSGSFGGTYFRPIYSSIVKKQFQDEAWKELPEDWLEGLNIKRIVASSTYRTEVNKYHEKCGQGLEEWENSGWITAADPYGWFQWYCRFYQGRRCSDDQRQISRGLGVMGPKGRWKRNLINKISAYVPVKGVEGALNDFTISPKIRQLLQHWAYVVTAKDL